MTSSQHGVMKQKINNMTTSEINALIETKELNDMLNLVQTTIGILLTGIFGFILGNKIRNQ